MEPIKAIVVGRHAPDFGDMLVNVLETRNVTFPATAEECKPILRALALEAREKGAKLLLQAAPTQVTAALIRLAVEEAGPMAGLTDCIGLIVSVPSAMPSAPAVLEIDYFTETMYDVMTFLNPRARHENVPGGGGRVVAEQPRPFVFSHIEWLY